jgi:hypothetical protein
VLEETQVRVTSEIREWPRWEETLPAMGSPELEARYAGYAKYGSLEQLCGIAKNLGKSYYDGTTERANIQWNLP